MLHAGLVRDPTKISRSKHSRGPCGLDLRTSWPLQCRQCDQPSLYLLAASAGLYADFNGATVVSLSGAWRLCSLMPCDSGTRILTAIHSADGCHFHSHESLLSPTPAGGRHSCGFGKKSLHREDDNKRMIIISFMVVCDCGPHRRDLGHGLDSFISNVSFSGKLLCRGRLHAPSEDALTCPCRALLHVCQPSCHFSRQKVAASRACWCDPLPWSQAASEAAGTFVLVAEEDPKRQRRCAEAHGGVGAQSLEIGVISYVRDPCAGR